MSYQPGYARRATTGQAGCLAPLGAVRGGERQGRPAERGSGQVVELVGDEAGDGRAVLRRDQVADELAGGGDDRQVNIAAVVHGRLGARGLGGAGRLRVPGRLVSGTDRGGRGRGSGAAWEGGGTGGGGAGGGGGGEGVGVAVLVVMVVTVVSLGSLLLTILP